jgi:hypothetical protein
VSGRTGVARASIEVALDAATAFDVFTAEIGEWYVVNEHTVVDHTRTKTMRIEPWVGGRFVDVHDIATGEGIVCGRVLVWDPPRRVVFVDERQLDVEVTFEPTDAGCRVTVEERGLDRLDPEVARHVRTHGWHRYLPQWFREHVRRGARR